MQPNSTQVKLILLALVLALLAGCSKPAPTAPPPSAAPTEPPPTAAPTEPSAPPTEEAHPVSSNAVATLTDVKKAVVHIMAEGSFVDPEFGMQMDAAGTGSGFIIDPSGLAVTNNHVVTGAALLRVWVGGERNPRNARILGVSECSDLAVIKIEGDDFSYLEWYDGEVTPGLEVYAAGYVLGETEYSLTRGIVSKERADGESDWASVNFVIEHDAQLNPGNSGGPLVTKDGQVVAVNYASRVNSNQSYAIGRSEAESVIGRLSAGEDVNSIGVNGQVMADGDVTGVWVASVKSGSPADKAGLRSGDFILSMEGLTLGRDGTMADYCDILRSHGPQDTLGIEVLRYATGELLEGQINGRELTVRASIIPEVSEDVTLEDAPGYTNYVGLEDDTGALYVEVPAAWHEVDGSVMLSDDGQVIAASIVASPDIASYEDTYADPGVQFIASRVLGEVYDIDSLLDELGFEECSYDGRYDYEDSMYTGKYDLYVECAGEDIAAIIVAAEPPERDYVIVVIIQVTTEADLEAAERILNTFQVIGNVP
ncbi:MAG: PDZ domain-containing protein [Chloroflexi bacterium]|nr:PDZ domain-containing protein [Chloroflexota bacterium]